MSRKVRVFFIMATVAVIAIVLVLIFGDEHSNEAREFLRNLLRAL